VPSGKSNLTINSSFILTMAMPQPPKFTALQTQLPLLRGQDGRGERGPKQCYSQDRMSSCELPGSAPSTGPQWGSSALLMTGS
jgi:hypothetical protein